MFLAANTAFYEELTPLFSRQSGTNITPIVLCAATKGRTVHLLKASSKAVPQERKRRKIDLAGTPQQWREHKEEVKSSQRPSLQPTDFNGMILERQELIQVQEQQMITEEGADQDKQIYPKRRHRQQNNS